jgi:hypothetical protein
MTLSIGVCQCQGITHPAATFATMIDGPDVGSPLAMDPFAQVGSGGSVTNFISTKLWPAVAIPPIPWARDKHENTQMSGKANNINLIFIGILFSFLISKY